MSRIVGIDLGTTNSLVAYVDATTGLPRVIPDREGQALLPSVVAFMPDGVLVGAAAKRQLVRRPETTVYSVKRLMGRGYEDVKDELCYFPFKVRPGDGVVRIRVGDREVTPPEVSAIVLKALKDRAEAHFGEPVEKAVVTVPAYFNDGQRQATKDAGRIAGLDVVRIVNEPTAASLAYGLQRRREGLIAVYDLGGGTFDISILRVKDDVFEVLATNGNTRLGGDDFDRVIVIWLLDDILATHGVYLGRDQEAMQELRLAAEAAKIRLSTEDRTALTLPFDAFTYHRELTRVDVEALIDKLVESTLAPCRMALADAGLAPADMDEVVLVGGSTRVPLVRRRVEALFGKAPHSLSLARFELRGVDPMPAGMPKIEVTFLIDANGILQVTAKELRTGKAAAIEVKPTYGLSEADVGRMVEDSFTYAEADVEARLLIETRNEADTVITHVERALAQGRRLIGDDEHASIVAALTALKDARGSTDRDRIREATTAMNRASEHLA